MKKKMTTVPFEGTAEQKAALDAVIAKHKGADIRMLLTLMRRARITAIR